MILDHTKIRRLVIFLFYDKDGIVDDYIPALFDGLKDFYDELCFVANGKLQKKGREKVEKYVTNFLVRENKGFDVWGYKAGLEFYGWEELEKYDEVILMNYTIFGPLYPFSEMFEFMNKKDLDFWGITKHHKVDFDVFNTCKYGYIPEHIQSSFLVIRNSLLRTKDYQDLWKNMPMINSYAESVGLYEVIFTKEFNEKGYKSGVYIDTSDLEGYTRYPLMMMSDELIINRRCPIIKLKSFSQNYMDIIMDTIGSCKNNTSYDVDLIWQNILRTSNMASIKRLMHLNYILPTDYEIKNSDLSRDKILLIFHIYFEDLLDESIKYMKSMPKNSDLLITTPKKELKEKIELKIKGIEFKNIEIRVIENRGRDVSSLLVGAKDVVMNYDYICFMHDKKTTQLEPYCAGQGFRYKCYENNLATKEYVKNLIGLFKENKRLGMLMPSPPNHSNFFHTIGNEWASNLKETKKLAKILDLNVDIHWGAEPISPLGTMFWFRPQALKKLFDYGWTYSDFPEEPNDHDGTILHGIERIYGFVTQDAGYYCAWCFTEKLARIELTNTFFGLGEINRAVFKKNYTTSLYGVVDLISHNKINLSYKVKIFLKKVLPKSLWRKFKNIYHKLKGIK